MALVHLVHNLVATPNIIKAKKARPFYTFKKLYLETYKLSSAA